jgi:lactoylglutathione lyase
MTRYIVFLFVCLYSLASKAQSPNFQFTVNHLALSVKDVNKAAAFYQSVLQLTEITNRTQMPGIRWFSLGEGKELHLVSTITAPVTINKAVHLALTTPYFDDFVLLLNNKKIPYSDWPGKPNTITTRADGIKQLYFQDPDGYWIEINSVAVAAKKAGAR